MAFLGRNAPRYEIELEHIPGQSLDKFADTLHLSTLSEEQCGHIWRGVAAGLGFIHEKGMLHNDIKPGNTMFHVEQQRAVLIDFGLATKTVEVEFPTGGTPWYLAPEYQFRVRSFRSDVWALGIVMLFALRYTPLPDSSEKSWDVTKVLELPRQSEDAKLRNAWLEKVDTLRTRLPARHQLLRRVLEPEHADRLDSKELMEELPNKCTQMLLVRK